MFILIYLIYYIPHYYLSIDIYIHVYIYIYIYTYMTTAAAMTCPQAPAHPCRGLPGRASSRTRIDDGIMSLYHMIYRPLGC